MRALRFPRRFAAGLGLLFLIAPLAVPTGPALGKPASMAAPPAAPARPAPPSDAEIARQLDALLAPLLPADQPGAAVLVARNGKAIYRRGFGLADVEKKVPVAPEAVFRIGSVTKQFTSALVMRLVDQGKLALADPITKYLPDYPTQGQLITIENLLTHTSGIANYTELPAFQGVMTQALSHEAMTDLFKNEPRAFPPGEGWAYSNSGYYLLGVIIEKVTGRSYAENLQKEIFGPLGMTHSGYGKDTPSFPGEAHGYNREGDRVVPANPLSMALPFAAGSIVSSVDDLLKWDNGLNAGKVLKPESLKRTFTPFVQKNGRTSGYGYGWVMGEYEGHPIQQHNGGINGFVSQVARLPEDHIYVAMLVNTEAPTFSGDLLATKINAIAVGQPLPEPGAYTMSEAELDRFVGTWATDSTNVRFIRREGSKLYSQRPGSGQLEIFPASDSTFGFVGRPARLTFGRGPSGRFDTVTINQSGLTLGYRRTSDTAPPVAAAPVAITLTPAQLDACVGRYALAPTFIITVTHEGASLMAQATGQPKFEIFPTSPTNFFLKVVEAQVEFTPGADGKMASLTLHQNGQHLPGKRVE